jgi:hypothetical protein
VVPLLVALVLVTRGAALWLLALGWFVLARARSGAVSQGWRYGPLVCRRDTRSGSSRSQPRCSTSSTPAPRR